MKYLQMPQILQANQILKHFEEANTRVSFQLETYKCKFTRKEKQLFDYKDVVTYLRNSLRLSFPDHETSNLRKTDFQMSSLDAFREDASFRIGSILDIFSEIDVFIASLCDVFDLAIDLDKCVVYSLDKRWGPFEGCAWFFCYLFYNKKKKRILLFATQMNKM